ncbi:ankyrin repeat domain-containing protein [uncultured Brachyspira sp.]|uniref:ankyrin repeat domain-containing protein n=1 Tax=uncultured Brachyspira sp. TaxID=221953 RepID=UPI00263109AE|nr:ankyrin repeat domain-containing protein [uncultured Brachyspira sp.]
MKKIVLMAVLYTLFSFNALYPELSKDEKEFVSYIANGNKEEVLNFLNNKKANINLDIMDGATPLMLSIIYKQDEIAKLLIEKGADLNKKEKESGATPLILSILYEQYEIAEILIKKGANVNIKDNSGFTALIHAIQREKTDLSKMLIEKKSDVNTKITFKTDGLYLKDFTPLTFNVDIEIAELLIKAGAKVNTRLSIKDDERDIQLENITPLMWVIFDYNPELAKLLIEAGADINAKDKDGNTALDYARYRNNSEIEQLLIEKGAK